MIAAVLSRADAAIAVGDWAGVEAAAGEALAVAPDSAEALHRLQMALQRRNAFAEAEAIVRRILELRPDSAGAFANLGTILLVRDRPEEAVAAFQAALERAPPERRPEFEAALAMGLLSANRYGEGFRYFEARPSRGEAEAIRTAVGLPDWQGDPARPCRLVLIPEQGLGDTLHFLHCAHALVQRGFEVFVLAQPALIPLLDAQSWLQGRVLGQGMGRGARLPRDAVAAPLLSLPYRMGLTAEALPLTRHYLTAGLASTMSAAQSDAISIGLCWRGNPKHIRDAWRSMSLERLLADPRLAAAVDRVRGASCRPDAALRWVNLQYAPTEAEQRLLSAQDAALPDIASFDRLAAAAASVDLVVTVDTSLVHLTGALGIPTLLLTAPFRDWRWSAQAADGTSLWYPSVTVG